MTKEPYKYFPQTKDELISLIKYRIEKEGNEVNLNDIDVSKITDMSGLFSLMDFNGDISGWNVSNVTNMSCMFGACINFNQDISRWDVSNVKYMRLMFSGCKKFNQDISKWNVSKVTDMLFIFAGCKSFNQDLSKWDISSVTDADDVFNECSIKDEYKPKFK